MKATPFPDEIYFVRHAQSVGNTMEEDIRASMALSTVVYELTDHGRWQAEQTGAWLRQRLPKPDRIIRSHYLRTDQTAALLYPNLPVREDALVAEADRGNWRVMTEQQMQEHMPWEVRRRQLDGPYHYRPAGGESWPDVEQRVRTFMRSIRTHYQGQRIVVVTHSNWLLCLQRLRNGWSTEEVIRRREAREVPANASVLIYRDGGPDPHRVNRRLLLHDPATDYVIPWKENEVKA